MKNKLEEIKFNKLDISNSEKYSQHKDLIMALLEGDTNYTLDEVNTIIDKFLKEVIK